MNEAGRGSSDGATVIAAADADELLELAVQAARMAGGLLAERVRHGAEREVTSKSTPTDLVSEADVASQHAIRELLAAQRPQDGFVGEEEGTSEAGSSGLSWIVDPLDGTVNYLFGIPQWSVSVAVADDAGAVAGAVFDANRDELFAATRGGPATLQGPRGTIELQRALGHDSSQQHHTGAGAGPGAEAGPGGEDLASAMVATGLAYDAEVRRAQAEVLARLAPRVRDIRRMGSAALDLAWTAAGRFDAYYERSVKQWDIAAGALICQSAGLQSHELSEQPGLPWGILVAPSKLCAPLLELVGGR
ncbi:MAG TPA: inositol monophosphatase family protein [Solirubrobacteraceae bacterium]|nr:inositol monophosphatase family protein [Solirubrobacteraceae bacterium]